MEYQKLNNDMKESAEKIGINPEYLMNKHHGIGIQHETEQQISIHIRFYSTMILWNLINEVPIDIISQSFGIARGTIQSLQNTTTMFSVMIICFVRHLKWNFLEVLFQNYKDRINFGADDELIPLLRGCNVLNAERARYLYNSGYKSVEALDKCTVEELYDILSLQIPFMKSNSKKYEIERKEMQKLAIQIKSNLKVRRRK